MLKLGENLKRLRTQNELTQEQLADSLGVSPQAVSRWEKGSTYPDITFLPAIANYFNITLDELLGVDIERKQQEIDDIIQHNCELHYQGKVEESVVYLREKIRTYPNSANITYQLAHALYQKICKSASHSEEAIDEVIRLLNRAIKLDKGETFVTSACKQHLCFAYRMKGCSDKAIEIAESMPSIWVSREILLPKAQNSEDELRQRQYNLLTLLDLSMLNLHHLSRKQNTAEESIELLRKAVELAQILTGDDHKFYNERVFKCYLWIAKTYCSVNKIEETFENLNLALRYAIMYEERPQQSKYDVFWLSEINDSKSTTWKNSDETLYHYLLQKISEDPFSAVHGDTRYSEFTDKVKQIIQKPAC